MQTRHLTLLASVALLLLPGCPDKQVTEDNGQSKPPPPIELKDGLGPLQEKKVVAFEVRDVETGSEEVVRIEDEKIIKKLLEVASKVPPGQQVVQMACWGEITFFFEDGTQATGTFDYDPDEKKLYVGDWILQDLELWRLLKEPLSLPDRTQGVSGPGPGPPPGTR